MSVREDELEAVPIEVEVAMSCEGVSDGRSEEVFESESSALVLGATSGELVSIWVDGCSAEDSELGETVADPVAEGVEAPLAVELDSAYVCV